MEKEAEIADSRKSRKFKRPLKNLDDVKTLKKAKGDVLLFGHILHGDPEISARQCLYFSRKLLQFTVILNRQLCDSDHMLRAKMLVLTTEQLEFSNNDSCFFLLYSLPTHKYRG